MKKAPLAAVVFAAICVSVPAKADINCFCGPWDPVDTSGNLMNYGGFSSSSDWSFSASITPDYSTLTLEFSNPGAGAFGGPSIFSNFLDQSRLPTGTVSYNWAVTFQQSADWIMETDVNTHIPDCDCALPFDAGTYTGSATLNYTTGNYFSFGNIGFGAGALSAVLTLTDFQYTGDAVFAPEPATALALPGGLLLLYLGYRLRKRRVC